MDVVTLIEAAKKKTGTLGALANKLGKHQNRISEWKRHTGKPSAAEIALMAKIAGLPVLITLAMVEAELEPETAPLWHEALGELEGEPDPRKCQNRAVLNRKPGCPAGFFSGRKGCAARSTDSPARMALKPYPHACAWVPLSIKE